MKGYTLPSFSAAFMFKCCDARDLSLIMLMYLLRSFSSERN